MKILKDYPLAITVNSILDGMNRENGLQGWPSSSSAFEGNPRLGEPSIREEDDHYQVEFLLPGINRKDLSLSIDGQTLVYRLENKDSNGGNHQYLGLWRGNFSIPEDAETKRISAKLTDGVLSVTIPKQKKAKPIELRIS
tara:strand:+ start:433 stop:852 length:420 start_codon:yes stop_codon:yes gene_type:complete